MNLIRGQIVDMSFRRYSANVGFGVQLPKVLEVYHKLQIGVDDIKH